MKKVHSVVQFRQSAWLKPYAQFNTEKRNDATSEFDEDFFQLMNNAPYGKTTPAKTTRCRINKDDVVAEPLLQKEPPGPVVEASPELAAVPEPVAEKPQAKRQPRATKTNATVVGAVPIDTPQVEPQSTEEPE